MSKSLDSVIYEVLKLYDEVDEQKIPNKVQQLNFVESDGVNLGNSNVLPLEQHVYHNKESVVPSGASSVVYDDNVVLEQKILNEVQQTSVSDSDNANMGNSNIVPYEQYVKHNEESVVPSSASSVQNDDHELHEYTTFPDDSLHTRLKICRDQLAWYEQCAKFELTEREQRMESQMCTFITERNLREETLKKELVSLQKQFDQTVKQKQEIQESVQVLKQDFKEKETKLLNDFSNLKTLKTKSKINCTVKTIPYKLII